MRMEYLKSVLRQDVGFFDDKTASSSTFKVISTVTSDAHLIQDTIADKVTNSPVHFPPFPLPNVLSVKSPNS